MKKVMPLMGRILKKYVNNFKQITVLCHIKIKLKLAWKHDDCAIRLV